MTDDKIFKLVILSVVPMREACPDLFLGGVRFWVDPPYA